MGQKLILPKTNQPIFSIRFSKKSYCLEERMIISFIKRTPTRGPTFFSLDFYRFRHNTEEIFVGGKRKTVTRPLWIVGVSPFDGVISSEEGYVVHLGAPRFTARWTMLDGTMGKIKAPDYYDEDLNIMLYEAAPLDDKTAEIEEWMLEAICAVAYSKGLITAVAPKEH
jgi:hypothetical protein